MEKCYCTKSELDLFVTNPIQLAIERSSMIEIHPLSSITSSNTIEFQISGLGESYFDPSNIFLHVQAKILKSDGTVPINTEKCAPINYALNTIFGECYVSLNEKQISSENNYAYKAFIQSTLFYPESSQKNLLSAAMFVKDSGSFEDVNISTGSNEGLKKRYERTKEGQLFDLYGPLHIDLATQSKLLLNGVSIRIKLEKAKNAFALLASNGEYGIHIENASLFIRRCEISGSILVAHEKALEQSLVQMPFTRSEVKTFTLSSGLKSITIPNAVNGVLPSRIIMCLVSNSAFNGDFKKNPFHFKNYDLNHLSLVENGSQIPPSAYVTNYAKNIYARNYLTLFGDLGQNDTNISFEEYKDSLCFYAFDLTQDTSAGSPFSNIVRNGDIAVHLKFGSDLPETLTLVAYMEFQSLIEIDKSRNIFTDY